MEKERYYNASYGAFMTLIDPDGPSDKKQRAKEGLVNFSNDIPEFREQAIKAYKDTMEEIVLDSNAEEKCIESLKQLNKVGVEMGIAEELSESRIKSNITTIRERAQLKENKDVSTSSKKSKCCLLT